MHPASKRSTRSRVTLALGPMSIKVDVYGGVFDPPSPKNFCRGSKDSPHEFKPVTMQGGSSAHAVCPACNDPHLVKAYPDDTGALVPIDAAAAAARLSSVEPIRDRMTAVSVPAEALAAAGIDGGKIHWLVPSSKDDEAGYVGLVRAIEAGDLTLVTCWASRTVGKLYRIGTHAGMLTLAEQIPAADLRACPIDPVQADETAVVQSQMMWTMASTMATGGAEQIAEMAKDPGREVLAAAANAAQESPQLKLPRGDRATFSDRAAEAAMAALMERLAAQTAEMAAKA